MKPDGPIETFLVTSKTGNRGRRIASQSETGKRVFEISEDLSGDETAHFIGQIPKVNRLAKQTIRGAIFIRTLDCDGGKAGDEHNPHFRVNLLRCACKRQFVSIFSVDGGQEQIVLRLFQNGEGGVIIRNASSFFVANITRAIRTLLYSFGWRESSMVRITSHGCTPS